MKAKQMKIVPEKVIVYSTDMKSDGGFYLDARPIGRDDWPNVMRNETYVHEDLFPFAKIWRWSEKTFGDGLRTKGVIQHITKELKEIEANPLDLEEWTDLILLSLDGFWRHCPRDLTKEQMAELLSENIRAKFAKNQARDWPDWRTMGEDIAIEHDRTPTKGGVK